MSTMVGPTRVEIGEQITRLRFEAGREMPVTSRFTTDPPTPYDVKHHAINVALNKLYPPTA